MYNISNINNNLPVGLLVPAISLQVHYNIITFISIALTHWFVVVSSLLLLFTYSQFCIGLLAKFFFLPWFCRFITSHPVSQPSVSYSALNFDLIRSIHRQLGTMVLGKVRLLLSCGKISLVVVEQAWKNITKRKQLVNKLRLTFHDQVKILRQNF